MAVKEVNHFLFGVQLRAPARRPVLIPPEPVAKSPPDLNEVSFGRPVRLRLVGGGAGVRSVLQVSVEGNWQK
jgi:hypothetical protein